MSPPGYRRSRARRRGTAAAKAGPHAQAGPLDEFGAAQVAVSDAELSNWELANKIEDEFGVHVVVAELPDRVDRLSFQDGDFRIIVLDSTEKVGRQRFTLAHEFGHILMGDAERLHEAPMNSSAQVSAERKANAFAAAFLAPEAEVRSLLGEGLGEAEFDRRVAAVARAGCAVVATPEPAAHQ